MSAQPLNARSPLSAQTGGRSAGSAIAPAGAIPRALEDTLRLLFRPFDGWKWIQLSALCLLLGGGATSAALQWSLGALPVDLRFTDWVASSRQYVEQHPFLIFLIIAFALALGIAFLYLRSVLRFVLVDSLVRMVVEPGSSWSSMRPLGQSYFPWLVGTLAALGLTFGVIVIAALPRLRTAALPGAPHPIATALLALLLALVIILGLVVTLLIMLTDDLVVPLMYAGYVSLPSAWEELWKKMRHDPASFILYVLLRFTLSVGVSVAVLFFLIPVLIGIFSIAIIVAALVVLSLHLVGLTWAWNLFTISLAFVGLLLLSAMLLVLLGVAGMPGQVFLQSFGLRFIAARSSSLRDRCYASRAKEGFQ